MNQRMDTIHAFMANPIEIQETLLKQLLKDAAKTTWGEKYDYKK